MLLLLDSWMRPSTELSLRIEMGAARRRAQGDLFGVFLLFTSASLAVVSRSAALDPDEIAIARCSGTGASAGRLKCLAKSYAPLLKFDSGEVFIPSSVDGFLPHMKHITADGSEIPDQPLRFRYSNTVSKSATPLKPFLTAIKFLNETEIDPRFMFGRKPLKHNTIPMYTSIVHKETGALFDFVYYAFYPYNKRIGKHGFGNHVGNWGHVTLRISFRNSPNPQLLQAFTNQHSSGECLTPSNITFVVDTPHPILYVATSSYGTYYRPGRIVYLQILGLVIPVTIWMVLKLCNRRPE